MVWFENQLNTSESTGMPERKELTLRLSIRISISMASSLSRIASRGISVREEMKMPRAMHTRPNRKKPI